ncbi:alpha/beta hydrolase, partial [Mangrovihabitans endophyticus]
MRTPSILVLPVLLTFGLPGGLPAPLRGTAATAGPATAGSATAGSATAGPATAGPATALRPATPRPAVTVPTAPPESGGTPPAVVRAMRAAGQPYASWAVTGRHFLAFDATGDGTAVEVLGDPSTATHVAILVPGVNTSLRDFDRGLGGVARRAPAVQARALHAAAPGVAVVAWLGYDPPDGLGLQAARQTRARSGAAALRAFVTRLTAGRPHVRVTLIGHSYGALVVGLAAPGLPAVTDVVALGAPGMGVQHARDLDGVRVWSALAETDWIRRIPQLRLFGLGHGRRPSTAAFGARPLPVAGVDGHDGYLVPGSPTLTAVA